MASQDWIDIFQEKVMELNEEDDWQIEFDHSIKPNGTEPGWQQYITKAFASYVSCDVDNIMCSLA